MHGYARHGWNRTTRTGSSDRKSLRELVDNLVRKYGMDMKKAILDRNGDIDMEIRVVVNEKSYLSGNRMETILNEGDMISFRGAS